MEGWQKPASPSYDTVPLCDLLVQVTVEGLEIMNDDPSEVDVLYAKVIHQKKILFKFFLFLK
jgi:hypothetical protein